ncbi:MAG: PD-(D/E)XK nuclease family transposase, partial [Eubacteriales bacterium]|nr:PD-(D/E)XK nuclease family transposase [Eubacteriales bacterium]
MTGILQQYFPMIRTGTEVMEEIQASRELQILYNSWSEKRRKEFVDFCTGAKGVKILYDAFFKEILNPETRPERIESLLSTILGRRVRLLKVLPNDNSRIADESSLLIMDILVELEDGSIANVETQKLGYRFPGERSACYSADLLLRQYKRVRREKSRRNEKFSYADIKQVYTIVFFEKSTADFKAYPGTYIHRFRQQSDTGLQMDLLQEFIFIPLDVFHSIIHNNGMKIDNKEAAWLTFLSEDSPKAIVRLIESYPEFKEMYNDIYKLCRNMEWIMGIFSEELRILDRNTVQLMIDDMQEALDSQKEELMTKMEAIEQQREVLAEKEGTIE